MNLEQAERRHDLWLRVVLVGIGIGTLGLASQEFADLLSLDRGWSLTLSVITLIGWVVGLVALAMTSRSSGHELLASVVEDERVGQIRNQAYAFGLVAVLVLQLVLQVANVLLQRTAGVELSVGVAANVTIAVAVMASLGRFLHLNR